MKKALSICLFLSLMAGCLLTGCDRTSTANSSSVAETTAATTATEAVTETETTAEESETEETETTAEESADAEDAETTTAAKEKDTSKDGNLWADFDNMSFKINGKTYTLGKTTLQELIDDGVPFDENDLANAGNNINPRYESSSFEIKLGERSFAQVRVLNDSSDNKKASECFIDNVYMPIYDEPQDILEFNFPLTMTQEELLLLLYDELVKRLMQAELALDKKEYPLFEASVQRGIEIIDYLDSTLDRKYEISHNLGRLYEYFDYELGRAKIGRRKEPLTGVKIKAGELRDAFREAAKTQNRGSR